MHTNPLAKMFIKLYDPSGGAWPTTQELEYIAGHLQHAVTRNKLQQVYENKKNSDLQKESLDAIYAYIQTFINPELCNIKQLFEAAIKVVYPAIIKTKKILYVYSMIHYEIQRVLGLNCTHFVNPVEKDATSSGLQMISILFKSLSLAKISNLLGTENYDIYKQAADNLFNLFEILDSTAREIIDFYKIEPDISLNYKTYMSNDYYMVSHPTLFIKLHHNNL